MLLSDGQEYHVHPGDCILHMMEDMPPASVDFCITSPPYAIGGVSMYAYTDMVEDIGNDEDRHESKIHLSYLFRGLRRVVKPGRVILMECMQVPNLKRAGGRGLHDFRGILIRLAQRAGLIYEYDWTVRNNPQAQAVTTKTRELQFAGLHADRARSRGALPNVLIKLTVPEDNADPIDDPDQISNERWIRLAENQWEARKLKIDARGKTSFTLNAAAGDGPGDTKHVCPMRLSPVWDGIQLFSDPDEVVYDPFNGIGTTGFVALLLNRRYYGCELKASYRDAAERNLKRAIRMRDQADQPDLPGFGEDDVEETEELAEDIELAEAEL